MTMCIEHGVDPTKQCVKFLIVIELVGRGLISLGQIVPEVYDNFGAGVRLNFSDATTDLVDAAMNS